MTDRILVIKLGALGDFVQALGPMQAIRGHHAGTPVDLLTTPAYADLAEATGFFDRVIARPRMRWYELGRVLELRRLLRGSKYVRAYDLQTSDRSSLYYRLMGPGRKPEWSGIAAGCSHPHANPNRDLMHTVERQAEQLAMAGIDNVPPPSLAWADNDISRFGLTPPFALLVPGGSAHRPEKRWPAANYGALAKRVADAGVQPILAGGPEERALHQEILAIAPEALSLAGGTSLVELAALAKSAMFAVGNDTGAMHLAAAAGIPTIVLYSHASDPALCAQRGPGVTIIREQTADQIPVERVFEAAPL